MLYFALIMFVFALTAEFRGPVLKYSSVFWFFIGWLPGELPWLFALIQILGMFTLFFIFDVTDSQFILSLFIAAITFIIWFRLHLKTQLAGAAFKATLVDVFGKDFKSALSENIGISSPSVIRERAWLHPFRYKRSGVERIKDISYGDAERNLLDIYKTGSPFLHKPGRPVLLHVHGGAWTIGNKHQQAQPLINYLAKNGWICVDINYRLAPRHRYPRCLIDVKKAIVWIKENISAYGGDPNFIAVTGGSAGGHLCALAGLTANLPEFQPGFESSDTEVQAIIPVYAVYDLTNHQRDGLLMRSFLEKHVMSTLFSEDQLGWENASPLFRTFDRGLPVFVIHGDKDCVVPVKQAREFVRKLKKHNNAPILYAELPGAQHGFDIFHSIRTEYHLEAVGEFLHHCYYHHSRRQSNK